ncbi:MAG: S-layer homology domain-containing protein [Firmicutes bacterium]|nr:S-layer homology domain-containing protein [Bacillota bacterium]
MKRISLLLILIMILSLAVPASSFAAVSSQEALTALKALGIMTGDERGDLHLDRVLTRAQLAKMLCAASPYKDTVNEEGLGYSVYKDVAPGHWAGQYIRLCAQQSWLSAYSDGSFRPSAEVKLEEVCSACLKLLGYGSAQLTGSYPQAQLTKASALGLIDSVRGGAGTPVIRQDAAHIFYDLLSASTVQGMVYGQSLGYAVSGGRVDIISAVNSGLNGPYIAEDGEKPAYSFAPEKVYLNGRLTEGHVLAANEVYYYNEGLSSVWIYDKKASGRIDQAAPSASPSMVVIAGVQYQIEGSDASFELSPYGSIKTGDTVTLLLGMDDRVAGILKGGASGSYTGVVMANMKASDTDSASIVSTVSVFCTDGVTRSFNVKKTSVSAGSLVNIDLSEDGAALSYVKEKSLSGAFNKAGNRFAGYDVDPDVRIIDTDGALAAKVRPQDLAGCTLSEDSVRYYVLEEGRITDLVLSDATGQLWSYGVLTSVSGDSVDSQIMGITTGFSVYGSYVFIIDGVPGVLNTQGSRFIVDTGGFAMKKDSTGQVRSLQNLASVKLTELGSGTAFAGNVRYYIADGVQAYVKDGSDYYKTDLKDLDPEAYTVTGWYDDLGFDAGGKIRVVTAEKKS